MDELSVYKYQLEQVQLSLAEDPNNEELIKLSKDLEEVISLTAELQQPVQSTAKKPQSPSVLKSPSLPKAEWKLGDYCEVKLPEYSHQWMEGIITSLSSDRSLVTVIIQKTHETRHVPSQEIRPSHRGGSPSAPPLANGPYGASHAGNNNNSHGKHPIENAAEMRKKKVKSRQDYIERKEAEHSNKQQSWQTFQNKLTKKATPSLFKSKYTSNDSLFKSPEEGSSGGKVGVVNSGKPMTVVSLPKKIKPIFSHHSSEPKHPSLDHTYE